MLRPTLYLLPGLLCDASAWTHQQRDLADLATIKIANFYGFHSLTDMARAVLMDAPGPFALAGHSMGARVALEILRLAPDRVERLALLDTGIHPRRPGEAEKRQELVDLARTEGMAALAERWLPPMVHPDRRNDTALMQGLTEMVCRATPEIFAGQVRALLDRPDGAACLSTIACPTLVACGRQDAWSPLEQHETITACVRHATLTVFEDSGHMAPVERPTAVTAALRRWLQG
jgi:pimeloyl-ACP methyl ester carboxylesterase